ncbi:hypothetical protein [Sulfurospirillum diekertiae]|uniref:Uncharacterized protein n=1 Tax=Sulfurospirillum diekertiae TaxID=1854492 RepID=A0AA92G6G1_9BACT|nr:hypothetical protein [Sulfurospirillum diekertiae]QNA70447.1 hypothetical protein FA584_14000 [Sulfurospirillum diekertiae]
MKNTTIDILSSKIHIICRFQVMLYRGLAELFGRDVKTIGKHIGNVFDDGELEKVSVIANFATTSTEFKRFWQKVVRFFKVEIEALEILGRLI